MIINRGDIITLDDNNEYVVVSKTNYDNNTYYYIIDKNNDLNFKFCCEKNEGLVEINENDLITKLLPLFIQN